MRTICIAITDGINYHLHYTPSELTKHTIDSPGLVKDLTVIKHGLDGFFNQALGSYGAGFFGCDEFFNACV